MARSRGNRSRRRGAGRRKVPNDVQLSRFDLAQLDEGYLAKLPEAQLRALSAKLLADLKAAHERLEQNPTNSSRPPSSRAPWEGEERCEPLDKSQPSSDADEAARAGGEKAQRPPEKSEGKPRPCPGAPGRCPA